MKSPPKQLQASIIARLKISAGMVIRNMHRWAAHLMVLFVMLHLCRVFYTSAYKPPREFNWVVGVLMLILVIGNATKIQMQGFVKRLLNIKSEGFKLDASDALSLALGQAHMMRYKLT